MRGWYRMGTDALPAWLPIEYVAPHWITAESFFPAALSVLGYRKIGVCCHRDGDIWIHRRWYWYARLELFLQAALAWAMGLLIDQRIITGPEGGYYHDFRFNDPARWRWL